MKSAENRFTRFRLRFGAWYFFWLGDPLCLACQELYDDLVLLLEGHCARIKMHEYLQMSNSRELNRLRDSPDLCSDSKSYKTLSAKTYASPSSGWINFRFLRLLMRYCLYCSQSGTGTKPEQKSKKSWSLRHSAKRTFPSFFRPPHLMRKFCHCSSMVWVVLLLQHISSTCPILTTYLHVVSPQGDPWAHAHWRTARCPFSAATWHVHSSQGHPWARAHCRTARCPFFAAHSHDF